MVFYYICPVKVLRKIYFIVSSWGWPPPQFWAPPPLGSPPPPTIFSGHPPAPRRFSRPFFGLFEKRHFLSIMHKIMYLISNYWGNICKSVNLRPPQAKIWEILRRYVPKWLISVNFREYFRPPPTILDPPHFEAPPHNFFFGSPPPQTPHFKIGHI